MSTIEISLDYLAKNMNYSDVIELADKVGLDADDINKIIEESNVDYSTLLFDNLDEYLAAIHGNLEDVVEAMCGDGLKDFLEEVRRHHVHANTLSEFITEHKLGAKEKDLSSVSDKHLMAEVSLRLAKKKVTNEV